MGTEIRENATTTTVQAAVDDAQLDIAVDEPQLFYPDLAAWVNDWVAPVFLRKDNQAMRWCPQWWKHTEAVVVLMALWEGWELQRVEKPGALAEYLVSRFYPLMHELTSGTGPFQLCDPTRGHAELTRLQEAGVLPTLPAPENLIQILGGSE